MSLAYIDKEYENENIQNKVNEMILEEMRGIKKTRGQYLSYLPTIPTPFEGNIFLQVINLYL
jgi:hypothetical protein